MANHDNYVIQGSSLDAIANEVKILSDTSDKMTVDEITSNIAQVNSDVNSQADLIAQIQTALEGKAAGGGGTEEIENLIDESGVLYSTDGTTTEKIEDLIFRTDIVRKIAEGKVGEIEIMPYFDYSSMTSFRYKFQGYFSLVRMLGDIATDNVTNFDYAFMECFKLIELFFTNTRNVQRWDCAFKYCHSLKTIGTLDFSSATYTNQIFVNCNVLENISIVPETLKVSTTIPSPVLSNESIQSIIDGLAFVTTAQTLTLHADAKILQSQVDSANAKGWTVAGGTVVSEEEYYG